MKRIRNRLWGPLLLLVGGIAFGVVGYRALALEREVSERSDATRLEVIHTYVRADAARLGQGPRGRPMGHWRIEGATMTGAAGASPHNDWARLVRAVAYEGDPESALPRFEALLHPDMPLYVRQAAALHAAPLATKLGRASQARTLYELASQAHSSLLSAHAPPVRVRSQALRWLAVEDLDRGQQDGLRTLLNDSEDGKRLVDGDVLGPGRILAALSRALEAERAAGTREPWAYEEGSQILRLQRAAGRAELGLEALSKLPADGVRCESIGWFLRRGADIWLFPYESLLEPTPGRPSIDLHVDLDDTTRTLDPRSVRLDPPFQGVVLTVRAGERGRESLVAALVLALGLGVYVGGVLLVLRGWRRSRAVAHQQAEFMAAVSHEMKTPIASVRAMAELLADGGTEPERTRLYAERIEAEMQRLGGSVRNVLDAAQIERGALPVDLQPGDPAAVVERTAEAVGPAMEKRGFEFRWAADATDGTYLLDRDALEGVLLNFLDNATKFSAGEKRIELRGKRWSDGRYRISVLDRGRGIDPQEQERIFQRFYRGAAARAGAAPGVGLGLHIARQVAEAHGADLRARQREGGGAAFSIELHERSRP